MVIALPPAATAAIEEEYPNARNFCDGVIYRYLRQSQLARDRAQEGRWLARLSEGKRKDLQHLRDKLGPLNDALDSLLPMPGLWPTLQLGTLHRIVTLKCPEVTEPRSHPLNLRTLTPIRK